MIESDLLQLVARLRSEIAVCLGVGLLGCSPATPAPSPPPVATTESSVTPAPSASTPGSTTWVTEDGRHCAHEADTHSAGDPAKCGHNPSVIAPGWLDPKHSEWATVDEQATQKEREKIKDACCYTKSGHYDLGRPVHAAEDRVAITAPIAPRLDWRSALAIDLGVLSTESRARIGEGFAEDAALEHASVAEFSRFALSLMSLGAPARLVAAAHRAALDEIRHAEISFGLASAFLGRDLGPGALALDRAEPLPTTLTELVITTLRDGCIGETIASLLAAVAARSADAPIGPALSAIADDEREHASLAYAVVKWAIEAATPAERETIRAAIDAAIASATDPGALAVAADDDSRYGRVPPHVARGVHRAALAEVIVPALTTLRALGE